MLCQVQTVAVALVVNAQIAHVLRAIVAVIQTVVKLNVVQKHNQVVLNNHFSLSQSNLTESL